MEGEGATLSASPGGGLKRAGGLAAGLLLAVFTLGATVAPTGAVLKGPAFNDLSGDPYATAIEFLAGLGVADGFPDGGYHPQAQVTREEFAAFVIRELGDQDLAAAAAAVQPDFTDVSAIDPWAYGYIDVAQALNLMQGYPDGSFGPDRSITEAEAITVLVRLLGGSQYAQSLPGAWPADDLAAAQTIDGGGVNLLSDVQVNAAAPVTRDVLAQLLFNAGQVAPVTYGTDGGAQLGASSTAQPLFQGRLFTAGSNCDEPYAITGASNLLITVTGHFSGCSGPAVTLERTFNLASTVVVLGATLTNPGDLAGHTAEFALDGRGNVDVLEIVGS